MASLLLNLSALRVQGILARQLLLRTSPPSLSARRITESCTAGSIAQSLPIGST